MKKLLTYGTALAMTLAVSTATFAKDGKDSKGTKEAKTCKKGDKACKKGGKCCHGAKGAAGAAN